MVDWYRTRMIEAQTEAAELRERLGETVDVDAPAENNHSEEDET